ncbi:unnamed protein product [Knipowitschia caucasica]|uniref:ADP-ribosyl cyclase/cyclic ADP-ribose hydrolase n=1 Tax=Knipowitschia caucasica TaxID=637954 RepID=A0AAV2L4T8_KNICA
MEEAQMQRKTKSRKRRCFILILVIVIVVVCAVVLGLILQRTRDFKSVFTSRCVEYGGYDCEKTWSTFEQAYMGKDPCQVPPESYQALIEAAPIKPACNRMMFWSKTKDVVHDFTTKKECYVTMEDTFVGSLLDGLTWCSKEGSKDTFTSGCPGWSDCVNNTVRSFWNQASASFAQAACGKVSVMLNGSIAAPFSPGSIFASVEVKNFNPAKMEKLEVVLVTQETISNCSSTSLKNLQKELPQGIAFGCTEVPESRIEDCASQPDLPCGSCW